MRIKLAITIAVGLMLTNCSLLRGQPSPRAESTRRETPNAQNDAIDFQRARGLLKKRQGGEKLTPDEEQYLQRAMKARKDAQQRPGQNAQPGGKGLAARDKTGLIPLTEMKAADRYKGEDGGLYGGGQNLPPAKHQMAADAERRRIQPLDQLGKPAEDGRIALVSISMSNATQEFSTFKRFADADTSKSSHLTIVDCAQGGQAMAEWVNPDGPPWREADRRIAAAGIDPRQVQIAWIKLANKGPRGDLQEHGKKLKQDTLAVIHNAKARFPNLRIAYLASRIYGGYATGSLNPEPYAYESAFVVRWLIQDQMNGATELNYNSSKGPVKAPLLLWGPYFWGDGVTPRKADQLVWNRDDFAGDGTHPSPSGREKVARMLLEFFKTDSTASSWFLKN